MVTRQVWFGVTALMLAACSTVGPRVSDGSPPAALGWERGAGARAEASPPSASDARSAPELRPAPGLQGGAGGQTDYSPGALFMDRHGGFLTQSKRYEPKIWARYALMANAQVADEVGSFDLQEVRARADVPIALDPDDYITIGGEFRRREYDVTNNVAGVTDDDVYSIGLRIGAGVFVTDDTLLEAMLRPGVYSDLDGTLTSRDWQWFGNALATFRVRDDLFLKGGVDVSETFADFGVVPLAGLAWVVSDQWRLDLLLPHRAEISWSPNAGATNVSAGVYIEGDQYRLRSPANQALRRYEWQTQEITASVSLHQRFTDYFSVFGELGSTLAGDYKLRGTTNQRFDGALEPTFFFNAGIGIDF